MVAKKKQDKTNAELDKALKYVKEHPPMLDKELLRDLKKTRI